MILKTILKVSKGVKYEVYYNQLFLLLTETNPSIVNAEAENSETTTKPSDPVIEDNSSQITTTTTDNNLDPEDITDQLDEFIKSSPKRVKMD